MSTASTYMTIREAARELHVHDNTMRRYVDRGLVRAIRLPSGVRRVSREDVEALAPRVAPGSPGSTWAPSQRPSAMDEHGSARPLRPRPSLDDLVAPEIWRSSEELEAFLALTYSERDGDR